MASDEPGFGPLQLLVVGFETTERLHGQIAREIAELRGRGLIRVVDARMLSRDTAGELSEIDLNPLLGDPRWRPVAHLFGLNGAAANGGDAGMLAERDAGEAVTALAKAGIVEQALLEGAVEETRDLLEQLGEEPPDAA
jgi:hypothetical protein